MTIFYNSTINLSTDISINDLSGFTVDGDIGNVNRSLYFNISDINGWIGDGIGSTPQFGISNVGVEICKFTDNLNYGISDDTAHIDVSCIAVKFSYSLPFSGEVARGITGCVDGAVSQVHNTSIDYPQRVANDAFDFALGDYSYVQLMGTEYTSVNQSPESTDDHYLEQFAKLIYSSDSMNTTRKKSYAKIVSTISNQLFDENNDTITDISHTLYVVPKHYDNGNLIEFGDTSGTDISGRFEYEWFTDISGGPNSTIATLLPFESNLTTDIKSLFWRDMLFEHVNMQQINPSSRLAPAFNRFDISGNDSTQNGPLHTNLDSIFMYILNERMDGINEVGMNNGGNIYWANNSGGRLDDISYNIYGNVYTFGESSTDFRPLDSVMIPFAQPDNGVDLNFRANIDLSFNIGVNEIFEGQSSGKVDRLMFSINVKES